MEFIGWIAWGFTAYIALINLTSQSRNHGVRASMQRQGVMIAICCGAVLLLGWNKLLTMIAIPAAMMLSSMMMGAKMSNASDKFMSALEESQRTGEPHRDILKRKHGIELPDND
jgi:hypothetical protein